MKKIIHIYGHNLRSLQEHIKADSLPVELGGCIDDVDPGTWIAIVNSDFVKNGAWLRQFSILLALDISYNSLRC